MTKILVAQIGDNEQHYPGKTFKEVVASAPMGSDIFLDYYTEDEPGFKTFKRRARIGNTAENLTQGEFWRVWDVIAG